MSKLGLILFISALIAMNTGKALAQEPGPEAKRGWWWYDYELPKETEEEKAVKEDRKLPSLEEYTLEQLWGMHPDDFQALLLEFQKKAVMSPTVENVREYYTVLDIARRKASAFSAVASLVAQKYPELTLEPDYPVASPGRNARVRQEQMEVESRIRASRDDFALLYFYSPGCPYCAEQGNIMRLFAEKYGWQIKGIDVSADALASEFGVQTVPYVLLIYRNSADSIPVAQGVASLDSMEKRLYRGIRLLSGEITPEEFHMYEFQRGGGFDPLAPLKTLIEEEKEVKHD
jgi:conjugal transfer pilus assembly protein TraF